VLPNDKSEISNCKFWLDVQLSRLIIPGVVIDPHQTQRVTGSLSVPTN